MTIWAKVTSQFEGTHSWSEAPKEVEFLRWPHRHVFHVTVWVEQFHNERDVEYLLFKAWLKEKILPPDGIDLVASSCEHIAVEIGTKVRLKWPNRKVKVEVTEDGENGAVVEWLL